MRQRQEGECENLLSRDLEVERDLALLLIHTLVGQPAEDNFVRGVIGIDSNSDASRDI